MSGRGLLSVARGVAWPESRLPYGGQVFVERAALQSIQHATSWSSAALFCLRELLDLIEQMRGWAKAAADEGDRTQLDELFQRGKQRISRLIDGESGRFEPEALFEGVPLLLGQAPEGITPIQIYTGFGRPGFPTLSLLSRLGERPVASRIEGQAKVAGLYQLILDQGASSIEGIYEGKQLALRGERGFQITSVASYKGAERIVELVDRVNAALVGCQPSYCLESEICNRTLVGRGEVAVADFVWGGTGDSERGAALFDLEQGNLLTPERAGAMLERLQRAESQLLAIKERLEEELAQWQTDPSLVDWLRRWESVSVVELELFSWS